MKKRKKHRQRGSKPLPEPIKRGRKGRNQITLVPVQFPTYKELMEKPEAVEHIKKQDKDLHERIEQSQFETNPEIEEDLAYSQCQAAGQRNIVSEFTNPQLLEDMREVLRQNYKSEWRSTREYHQTVNREAEQLLEYLVFKGYYIVKVEDFDK